MKCRYKEQMEYFYLTKDNYEEFLNNFKVYNNDYKILNKNKNYIIVSTLDNLIFDCFYFNKYYISFSSGWKHYTKEEFEEKFEVID